MVTSRYTQPVPLRALGISLSALVVPVAAAFYAPTWTNSGVGMLVWLTGLVPVFVLAYYRGVGGVLVGVAATCIAAATTYAIIVAFDIVEPRWRELIATGVVFASVAAATATLSGVLRGERDAAESMALLDRLTELPNRRHAEVSLEREFAAAERGRELSVVMFDLDRFKQVNDLHGHAAGDQTLKAFANVLRANTRKSDLTARFGGEEFVAILPDTPSQHAVFFAQRVLTRIRELELPWGRQTVSAGVAGYQKGMGSHELLLSAADRALYRAKQGGRDMIVTAHPQEPQHTPPPETRRASQQVPAVAPTAPPPPPPVTAARETPLIYVVDDDDAVRSVVRRFLVGNGYSVWDTGDPLEAIRQYTSMPVPNRPELIVSDVIMPPMSGMRMIDQISQIAPHVKVIYMSGYVQSKISVRETSGSVITFLEKPLNIDELLKAVAGAVPAQGQKA
ncbi:MAG TPA: diguanylate cyclase [Gemmatimonadaceae bacterium]|nr:diguanylate cyclase [Gemmatimonadaceae bacterium]